MKGVLFDIQTYCIHDGPGIRTTLFFKGCALRCQWCHNPESWQSTPEIGYLAERCALCGACVAVCPQNALSMGVGRIDRDAQACVNCGQCVSACPSGAREMIGFQIEAQEAAERAVRDRAFFEASGGGVTISGGEATMQSDFLLELLSALREKKVHVALETCGYFSARLIDELATRVDLFLFDLKIPDIDAHRAYTGVSPGPIFDNFRALIKKCGARRVLPRIPVIPGVNTSEESVRALAVLLTECGHQGPVELMPYNRLARTKWEKLGRGGEYRDFGELGDSDLARIVELFEKAGIAVRVGV